MNNTNQLVFDLVVVQFSKNLFALKNILEKGKAHAQNAGYDANKLLEIKLAPDMFNFCRQVQMTTDNAKGAAARLAGKVSPIFIDEEKTMDELIARVEKTINHLESYKAEDFCDYENKIISFPWYPGKFLDGKSYLQSFALPNFYFHLTTTYDLLRSAGVQLGKKDFLGNVNWQDN